MAPEDISGHIDLQHELEIMVSLREDLPRIWGGFSVIQNPNLFKVNYDLVMYGPKGTTAKFMNDGYIQKTIPSKITLEKGYQRLCFLRENSLAVGDGSQNLVIDRSMGKHMIEGLLDGMNYLHKDPLSNVQDGVELMAQTLPAFIRKDHFRDNLFKYLPRVYSDIKDRLTMVINAIPSHEVKNGHDMKNKFFAGGKLIELPEFVVSVVKTASTVHLDW